MNGRWAFAALAALILVYLGPLVVFGEVIYPHDNRLEVGLSQEEAVPELRFPQHTWNPISAFDRTPIDNRKFSDQSSVYVPELHHHLHGDGRAWISTWNPHVELGRPTMQLSGLTRAFVLTRVLAAVEDDAFALYTWIFSLDVALTALFAYLFLRSLELHPWSATFAAAGLATGVFTSFWATFVMYLSTVCWTLALLWLVTIFVRRPTLARALGIAFATHALLLTGYPQQIVWHAYLLVAYTTVVLVRAARSRRPSDVGSSRANAMPEARALARESEAKSSGVPDASGASGASTSRLFLLRALGLAACVAIGAASALPVYLDVAIDAARTARLESGPEFFFSRLPNLSNPSDVAAYLVRLFDALWFGNPVDPRYAKFDGVSWTPLFAGFLAVACVEGAARKSSALWLAFVAAGLVMTVSPTAYLFGIDHLGLALSRFVPSASTSIPVAVIGAIVLDRALRRGLARPRTAAFVSLVPCAVALVAATRTHYPVHAGFMLTGLALSIVCAALLVSGRISWLLLVLTIAVLHYGQRLVLARPAEDIAKTSPLTERIASETRDGSRFTSVGGFELEVLPPNQEARLGLASIHSFDPLLPLAYKRWILRVSETGARFFGKQVRGIKSAAKVRDDAFTYAGVKLLVSPKVMDDASLARDGEVLGFQIYRAPTPPVLYAQIESFADGGANATLTGPLAAQRVLAAERTELADDRQSFALTRADRPTLLWVSQQHHPSWRATSRGAPLATVTVDDFYLGVVVPPGTDAIELEFRPWVLWAYVPQWGFAIAAAGVLLAPLLAHRMRARRGAHST